LQSWEEDRVVRSSLLVLKLLSDISRHSEVGILIDGTGND